MKQSFFLFALLSLTITLFPSCNNDDDNISLNDEIEGEWSMVSFDYDLISTSVFMGSSSISNSAGTGSDFTYVLSFDNGTYSSTGGYNIFLQTTDANGNPVFSTTIPFSNIEGTGDYEVDGNVIITDNSFISFSTGGSSQSEMTGEQMTEFEINADGDLVFDISQVDTRESNDIVTTTEVTGMVVFSKN